VNRLVDLSQWQGGHRMARMHQFIGLAVLSFALTGCVTSTDKYTAVKLENESLRSQLSDSESRARAAPAQAEAYK